MATEALAEVEKAGAGTSFWPRPAFSLFQDQF